MIVATENNNYCNITVSNVNIVDEVDLTVSLIFYGANDLFYWQTVTKFVIVILLPCLYIAGCECHLLQTVCSYD